MCIRDRYKRVIFTLEQNHSGRSIVEFSSLQSMEGEEFLFPLGTTFTIVAHEIENAQFDDGTLFEIQRVTLMEA